MAFLVYLATEVKGTLNTPFLLISHTDFSYTRNFVLQEYSWKVLFSWQDKWNNDCLFLVQKYCDSQTDMSMH